MKLEKAIGKNEKIHKIREDIAKPIAQIWAICHILLYRKNAKSFENVIVKIPFDRSKTS